jgi:hypothetical protein
MNTRIPVVIAVSQVFVVLLAWLSDARADERDTVLSNLRPGTHNAEVLRLRTDEKSEEIANRFMKAVASNETWFQNYVKSNRSNKGGLPYHPRFGVSKDEYERFQRAKRTLQPHSNCKLAFDQDDEGAMTLTVSGDAKILSGMRIDRDRLRVSWRDFASTSCNWNTPKTNAIAFVNSVSWTETVAEPKSEASSYYVAIGRFVESEYGFLNVLATDLDDGKVKLKVDFTLRWPLNGMAE